MGLTLSRFFHGPFHKWFPEINPMNLGNILSGLPGYAKDAWPNVVV